ncbi:glutamate--tRNA ligase [Afifella sp. IM 167]|uniref:glutamate--tRNA ligase n=1 Tax=Afifella sp. IM 167 TaxID=2033586 RepID=UPI001CCB2480|nr:glutamate--tRNA ligase [Afifella sp. IM 167]MBZ8132309.1 glutamate--tRNA ligase [Afifella sp. IM 167]
MPSPVTRFAPSPTGFLHIGGARTALFNWLYARGRGGKMLLRIEDTDRARSTDAAIAAILDGLSWLGLDWDGEPISQAGRAERHAEVAWQLVESGHAYRCYASQEELAEMRESARAEGRAPRYDGRWRDRAPSEAPEGVKPVIRVKAPQEGETIVNDHVQGRVAFPNRDLDDFIILRSDGTPTYMHAVVVDDHDMEVTHVIRGDDHLTNAARQTILYEALGWKVPEWAHIPLIHGPDGAKLSKRHGALGVEAYRAMGYLPEALRNYLARLGWGHGDDEIFSTEQATEWFDLDAIGKGAARFDFVKLQNVNGHYMRLAEDDRLVRDLLAVLPEMEDRPAIPASLSAAEHDKLLMLMPGLKERAKTLVELGHSAAFLFASRPLALNEKAEKILDAEARARLGRLAAKLKAAEWKMEALEEAVREFAEAEEVKLGKVAQPLRAALTGSNSSPGIFEVMLALGREEALARIADQAA